MSKYIKRILGLCIFLGSIIQYCFCANAENVCGDNTAWTYKEGVLTISGHGNMNDFGGDRGENVPWKELRDEITTIVISEGITGIGDYAFFSCANVSEVNISNTVVSIGEKAFLDCPSLTKVMIPDEVIEIGDYAFGYCYEEEVIEVKVENQILNPSQIEEVYTPIETFLIICSDDTEAAWYAEDNEFRIKFHVFFEPKIVEPTCVKEGKQIYNCKECGYSYVEEIACIAHSYGKGKVRKEASYYEEGIMEFACNVCGKKEAVKIRKLKVTKGTKFWIGDCQYRVISPGKRLAMLVDVDNDPKKLVVPSSVSFAGGKYKVTRIGEMAVSGKKKLKCVEFGKNIKCVEARAFFNCPKLKKIVIKGGNIKYIGENAFANTAKKISIKVPKKKLKYYKKLFRRKLGKRVKVEKG